MRSILTSLLIVVMLFSAALSQGDLDSLYFNTRFTQIVKKCDSLKYENLNTDQKLLYFESQARTAKGHKAIPGILKMLSKYNL